MSHISYVHSLLLPKATFSNHMITFCSVLWYAVVFCICKRCCWPQCCSFPFLRHATRLWWLWAKAALIGICSDVTSFHLWSSCICTAISAIAYLWNGHGLRPKEAHAWSRHVKAYPKTWRYSERLLGFCDGNAFGGIPKLTFCWLLSIWFYFWNPCAFYAWSILLPHLVVQKQQNAALHKMLHKASLWVCHVPLMVTEAAAGMWVQNLGLKYCTLWYPCTGDLSKHVKSGKSDCTNQQNLMQNCRLGSGRSPKLMWDLWATDKESHQPTDSFGSIGRFTN